MSSTHSWKFFRAGGFDQVRLDSGADLANLDQLDQKLWVALACPVSGLEFDPRTLALLDTDNDGRLRAPEIIAATRWACGCLKEPGDLLKGSDSLALSAINDATPEGKALLSAVHQILKHLGKPDATAITAEEAANASVLFAQSSFNGDGIVPADAAADESIKTLIGEIIARLGGETDRSGRPGVSQAKADRFFSEARAYSDWWARAEGDPKILPLGEATVAAAAAIKSIRAKVDDYFTRCLLAAFDPRSVNALNREEREYLAFSAQDLTLETAEIASFPLAHVEAGKPLPLVDGTNPAWAAALARLRSGAVEPLLGDKAAITEADWAALHRRLEEFERWSSQKEGPAVETLGLKRVRALLAGDEEKALRALIASDQALASDAATIANVEKLIRCHRDLYRLLNNFVCFRDFYGRKERAIFQAGTLYLDTRSCDLCICVEDSAKHGLMAGLSRMYLVYCDCVRKTTGEKMTIAAAFTDGDSDNLIVGRNGVFYDRQGRDWDATIVKIVENPISIRQAFWSPYKKVSRLIENFIAKRAAAAESAANQRMPQLVIKTETAAGAAKTPEPPPKPKLDTGIIAALGIAAAGVGGMVGGIVSAFLGMGVWMPLGVLAIMLLISCPSMVMAWLKLRQRNLGPLLDANGWALNAKAKINIPFGASLTGIAKLPPGSKRNLVDPFAEKKNPWPKVILVFALLALLGFIAGYYYLQMREHQAGPSISVVRQPRAGRVAPTPLPSAADLPTPTAQNAEQAAGATAPASESSAPPPTAPAPKPTLQHP